MLAFNLGVFFRNMEGEEIIFSARNAHCSVIFVGGVENLSEQTDLTHHLAVTLSKGPIYCHISFEDAEDDEKVEDTEVEVQLVQVASKPDTDDVILLETSFRFEEIGLKPAAGADDPDDGPMTA